MKFNKVIHDYMEEVLRSKADKANENDPVVIDYKMRRANAEAEIEEILCPVYEKVQEILERYDMDLTYKTYDGREVRKAKDVISFRNNSIENKEIQNKINANRRNRASTVTRAMRNIELECALGADRETFMKMLDKVVIE